VSHQQVHAIPKILKIGTVRVTALSRTELPHDTTRLKAEAHAVVDETNRREKSSGGWERPVHPSSAHHWTSSPDSPSQSDDIYVTDTLMIRIHSATAATPAESAWVVSLLQQAAALKHQCASWLLCGVTAAGERFGGVVH
jgi:hypothetical protein